MSVVGERVVIIGSTDKSQLQLKGEVVLETANTIVILNGGRARRLQKKGTVLMLEHKKSLVRGDEITGRPEDRLQRSAKR